MFCVIICYYVVQHMVTLSNSSTASDVRDSVDVADMSICVYDGLMRYHARIKDIKLMLMLFVIYP